MITLQIQHKRAIFQTVAIGLRTYFKGSTQVYAYEFIEEEYFILSLCPFPPLLYSSLTLM